MDNDPLKRCLNSPVTGAKCKFKQLDVILYQSDWQKLER